MALRLNFITESVAMPLPDFRYYWGRFKDGIFPWTVIRVNQDLDFLGDMNCDIVGSDDVFSERDFEFSREIPVPDQGQGVREMDDVRSLINNLSRGWVYEPSDYVSIFAVLARDLVAKDEQISEMKADLDVLRQAFQQHQSETTSPGNHS